MLTLRAFFTVAVVTLILPTTQAGKKKGPKECVLFTTTYHDVLRAGEGNYVELGNTDVSENFSIEMQVQPSVLDHDGNLFAIGSKREFPYYEWRTKANSTQYLVVEIVYSSVLLTLKALGTYNLHSLEIYRTFPVPYDIGDGRWHTIKAWRSPGYWHLRLDDMEVNETIRIGPDHSNDGQSDSTNVRLDNMPAFLGGRPGYIDLQYRGVIKNVKVNGRRQHFDDKPRFGNVEVVRCGSRQYKNFTAIMDTERQDEQSKGWDYDTNYYEAYKSNRDSTDSETSFFDHEDVDDRQDQMHIGGVY